MIWEKLKNTRNGIALQKLTVIPYLNLISCLSQIFYIFKDMLVVQDDLSNHETVFRVWGNSQELVLSVKSTVVKSFAASHFDLEATLPNSL